jgi:uncharacterized protein (DUF58 family)
MLAGRITLLVAGALFLFAFGRGLGLRVEGRPHRSQAVITPREVDLGTVQINLPIEHSFILRNAGNAPLLVTEVKSTCQCTVPHMPGRELAPGASESVDVMFTPATAGSKFQRVIIETNDPQEPTSVFTLRAIAVLTTQEPDQRSVSVPGEGR